MATNRLIDRLSEKDRALVLAGCEQVELSFLDVLAKPGDTLTHVYFPTDSYISIMVPVGAVDKLEVGLAGNEGFYGVPLAVGETKSPFHALVQGGGAALRMSASHFLRDLARIPALRSVIDKYIYLLLCQVAQTAGCTRFHEIEQRLVRWFLMISDRSSSRTFRMTHELLAYMLGVRRVGVTESAISLQKRGLIEYRRGVVTIVDRPGMQAAACSCYDSDIKRYKQVFSRKKG